MSTLHKTIIISLTIITAMLCSDTAVLGVVNDGANSEILIPQQILIKFNAHTSPIPSTRRSASSQGSVLDRFTEEYPGILIQKIFAEPGTTETNSFHKSSSISNALDGWYKITFSKNTDIEAVIDQYRNEPGIEYIEPDYCYQLSIVPNDSYYDSYGSWGQNYQDMWGLKRIGMQQAWDIENNTDSVIVAVIDTGVDYNHEDIKNNIWINTDEIPDNGIDDDGNGYVDDVKGWDFTDSNNEPLDTHGHGTHVSGIIAAVTDNAMGISGVSWNAKIMPVKSIGQNGLGFASDLADGIKYAVDNGARVINMSWGGNAASSIIKQMLDYAYENDCVLVAAAGNNNEDVKYYFPANYRRVISVAASDPYDQKASFSNYGELIDITAPGVDILSLRADGTDMSKNTSYIIDTNYYLANGTSMATPHVAGIAALILSNHPELTSDDVKECIKYSSDDLGDPGKDSIFGYGRINAYNALQISNGNFPVADIISVMDTPDDNGLSISVSWESIAIDYVKGYRVYYSLNPFSSVNEGAVMYYAGSPVTDSSATSCEIGGLDNAQHGYYVAVIADILGGLSLSSESSTANAEYISTTVPVYPVRNIVDTSRSDDTIYAGFDRRIHVSIPYQTNNGITLNIIKPESAKKALINAADDIFSRFNKSNNNDELDITRVEFKSSLGMSGTIKITVPYPLSITISDRSSLKIYELDEFTGKWDIIDTVQDIDTQNHLLTAAVDASLWEQGKVYRLFAQSYASSTLANVMVYPNPYKPNSGLGHSKITFNNITDQATVKIFTISGELVRTLYDDQTGSIEWDAKNENSQKLASGVYIYVVTNNQSEKALGKLAVIK